MITTPSTGTARVGGKGEGAAAVKESLSPPVGGEGLKASVRENGRNVAITEENHYPDEFTE